MKIMWKDGCRAKADALEAFRVFEECREERGGDLLPEDVVTKAKDPSNPLHDEFEWSNARAAKAYRLDQARYLIRNIKYERLDDMDEQIFRRVKIEVTNDEHEVVDTKTVYRTTEELLKDTKYRNRLLRDAINEANSYRERYYRLSELSKVIESIDDFLENAEIAKVG